MQWHSSEPNFTRDTSAINHWNKLENYLSKISFFYPKGQWFELFVACRLHVIYVRVHIDYDRDMEVIDVSEYDYTAYMDYMDLAVH